MFEITEDRIEDSYIRDGLSQCATNELTPLLYNNIPRTFNPRYKAGSVPRHKHFLLTNATLWNGDGNIYQEMDILVMEGLIVQVGKNLATPIDVERMPLGGHYVTPGLVDMHSHAGYPLFNLRTCILAQLYWEY
jgi:hypothetical protein